MFSAEGTPGFDARTTMTWESEDLQKTTKPLLLQEVGYHSWETAPLDQRSEAQQAELLKDAIEVVEMENIAGWMIWTAFDFQPVPGQAPIYEHYFGLWRNDLSPKPAVAEIFAD
jgi:hypothetical protein